MYTHTKTQKPNHTLCCSQPLLMKNWLKLSSLPPGLTKLLAMLNLVAAAPAESTEKWREECSPPPFPSPYSEVLLCRTGPFRRLYPLSRKGLVCPILFWFWFCRAKVASRFKIDHDDRGLSAYTSVLRPIPAKLRTRHTGCIYYDKAQPTFDLVCTRPSQPQDRNNFPISI